MKFLNKKLSYAITSALVLGIIQAVPAQAALITTSTISAVSAGAGGTATAKTGTATVGVATSITVSVATGTAEATKTVTITPTVTSKPALSNLVVTNLTIGTITDGTSTTGAAVAGTNAARAVVFTSTGASTAATVVYTFTPDSAGAVEITFTSVQDSGTPVNATITATITAAAAAGTPTLPIWLDSTASTVATATFVAALAAGDAAYTKGLVTGSMTAITTDVNAAVVLGVVATASTFRTSDIFDLSLNGTIVVSGVGDNSATSNNLTYTPAKAGTYTANIKVYTTASDRVSATATYNLPFTWTVVAASGFSSSLSTAYLGGQGGVVTAAIDSTSNALPAASSAAGTTVNAAAIGVKLFDAAGVAMANGDAALTLKASITGPGYLVFDEAQANTASGYAAAQCAASQQPTFTAKIGRSIASTAVDAIGVIYVCADGTAGVSTITASVTNGDGVTAQVGTSKTVTFYGKATKLAVKATNYTIGKAGGAVTGATTATSTTTPAIVIFQTDKDGVAANWATPTVVSSDVNVVASGSCAADGSDATYGYGAGHYDCSFTTAVSAKSGDKATLTFRILDPNDATGTTYLTTTQAVTVGGSVSKETITFDKTSYATGEKMVVTRTAVDSAGNPVFDGADVPAMSFSKSVGGSVGASTNGANKGGYVGGKKATSATAPTVFAPAVSGSFDGYMTSSATGSPVVTASATVTDGNAALLTQIDALNAKIVALNALIAKIMKKLGVK